MPSSLVLVVDRCSYYDNNFTEHFFFFFFVLQERGIVYEYYFYFCDSHSRDICLGIIYGYKAVLQIIALVFSFSIRKIKIKGLNDAKSIAAAVYVTSIVTAVIIVSFYSLKEYLNVYAILFCLGLLIGTTATLCLIFIPKVNLNLFCFITLWFLLSITDG